MNCQVLRSEKKDETYLFLTENQSFDELPEGLRAMFGEPIFVLDLQLSPKSKLARVDVNSVLESLRERGYFLQLPPKLPVEEEISIQLYRQQRKSEL
jgi:uncharacterized protein YcgL (UPF0745 family)